MLMAGPATSLGLAQAKRLGGASQLPGQPAVCLIGGLRGEGAAPV